MWGVYIQQMDSEDLYGHGDSIVMSDLLEDLNAVNLQGQQQEQNDDGFLGQKNGDYEKDMKALIAELDQQPLPPSNTLDKKQVDTEASADYMVQSIKNEDQMVRSNSLQMLQQQQQQQQCGSEAVNLRGSSYHHLPPYLCQNLYQIKEGVQQVINSHHYRSCSDSASNSTAGIPILMSPDLSQTPTLPPHYTPLGFNTPTQIHRRTRSEQLQLYGGGGTDNDFFQQLGTKGGIDMVGRGESYIDAAATHAAVGHMFNRAAHRRMHSFDDTQTHSYQQILQSPSAEYINPRIHHPVSNFQGYGGLGGGSGDVATLQYSNLENYKQGGQHIQEMQRGIAFPTSKKSSVQKRDKQLSPKSLKRVVANRQSAKRSRERKERYRQNMEQENQILKDTLQYLDSEIQQRQSTLSEAKQKNEFLRQAVQERLFMHKSSSSSQSSDIQKVHRNEQQKRSS
eukprot:TRINITY_DN33008_c0_g1_i6.p1 TRINITY_DN33008_c0_g1~~TRINITY_DN33008_c0_g1_i6.p1  ORF type:complete len:452 (+),score=68.06 TRINITY_DN33008_c0_g1_i6:214-1569(+)